MMMLALGSPTSAQDTRPTFQANWQSLNSRQSPAWFGQAKFGIFIHWGVYSVPAICDTSTYAEWYQYWYNHDSHNGLVRKFQDRWYGKDFKYRDFAPQFRAELWQPTQWAELFKRSGTRYVVLVSKHHDGFAMWPSDLASSTRGYPWNSVQTGPQRDICGELAEAVRAAGLKMGFYYSFMEWENPLFDSDREAYVQQHMIPQIKDLITRYKPAVFWPDGEWEQLDSVWHSPEILAWIYNHCENPDELVVNDRWGKGLRGRVGDFYTTEYGSVGGDSPGLADPNKPFEECRGIGHSFALNRLEGYDAYLSREQAVQLLIDKVSRGGNLLLDLGPTADGRIPLIQQDRIIAIGDWLAVNGESIYESRKGPLQSLPWGRSTAKDKTIYLHVFNWPANDQLEVDGVQTTVQRASLLNDPTRSLEVQQTSTGHLTIDLRGHHPYPNCSVIKLEFNEAPKVTPATDS